MLYHFKNITSIPRPPTPIPNHPWWLRGGTPESPGGSANDRFFRGARSMSAVSARDGELILWGMKATVYILLLNVYGVAARDGELILWGMTAMA